MRKSSLSTLLLKSLYSFGKFFFFFSCCFLFAFNRDHSRDPCPWVVLNDFGGAFAMGAIGGTVWHGVKGMRNSPRVSPTSDLSSSEQTTLKKNIIEASFSPFFSIFLHWFLVDTCSHTSDTLPPDRAADSMDSNDFILLGYFFLIFPPDGFVCVKTG